METQTVTPVVRLILAKNLKASSKFGDAIVEGAICLEVLEDPKVKALVYVYEGKRYLNIKVIKRKEATEYGKTHYSEVDSFVPKKVEGV